MRNKKGKLLAFSVLALCFACLAFGVYALKNATLTVNGTVGFVAHDCLVNVVAYIEGDGVVDNVPNNHGFPSAIRPLQINKDAELEADKNVLGVGGETKSAWEKVAPVGAVYFTDLTDSGEVAQIKLTFNITNGSAFAITASITNDALTLENVVVGASDEITIEEGATGTLTATFDLKANDDGQYPEVENLPFNVKLDFKKAGTGGAGEGGEDVGGGDEGGEEGGEQQTQKLDAPTDAQFNNDSKEITIAEVENADRYEVSVYEGESLVNTETIYGTTQILNTSYSLKENTTYNVKAKALGDNVTYTDSDLSDSLTEITITTQEEYTHNRIMSAVFGNGLEISKDETGAISEVNLYKIGGSPKSMLFTDKETFVKTETSEAITFTCSSDNDRSFSLVKDANGDITQIKYNGCAIMSQTANEPMTGVITRDTARNCTKIVVTQDNANAQVPLSAEIYVSDGGLILEEKVNLANGMQVMSMTYVYDDAGYVTRLINRVEINMNDEVIVEDNYIDYEYDANHNMIAYKEYENNNELNSYVEAEYNADNKITTMEEVSYSSQTHKVYNYTYDENGDLASETVTTYNTAGVVISTETIEYADNKTTGSTKVYYDEAGNQTKKEVSVYEYTDPTDADVYTILTTIYDANNNKVALQKTNNSDNSGIGTMLYYNLNEKEFTIDEHNAYRPGNPYQVIIGDIDEENYRYNSLTTYMYETDEDGNEVACQKNVNTYVYDDENKTVTMTMLTYNSNYEDSTVENPAYESKSIVVTVRDESNKIVSETTTYYSVSAGVETLEWTLVDNKTGTIERTYYNSDGSVWYVEIMEEDGAISLKDKDGNPIEEKPERV